MPRPELSLEGSKRAEAPYSPRDRGLWVKVKCQNQEEFVIIGWTDPEGVRPRLGALLLGYYDPDGPLRLCGARWRWNRLCGARAALASAPTASQSRDASRQGPASDEPIWITARPLLQRMMADRALHRRTTSAQHPNSERLDREPGPNDPAVAG
jgi:hypothetical protein